MLKNIKTEPVEPVKDSNYLEISRTNRFLASVIDSVVAYVPGGFLVIFIMFAVSGKTPGSMVMKFEFLREDGSTPGFGGLVKYLWFGFLNELVCIVTLFIFLVYQIVTMDKRNGLYTDHWSGIHATEA